MKTAMILYSSKKANAMDVGLLNSGYQLFVRTELVEVEDLLDALDIATPLPGETVLNTVWPKKIE